MIRRPPGATRTDTLFPYTTLFRSHIGDDIEARAGDDPTLYGYRAGVEAARFSKHVAKQVYGREPDYSYVWGGSGGGRRSPLHLEYCDGVYDGAQIERAHV